jgi:hypothetical protein
MAMIQIIRRAIMPRIIQSAIVIILRVKQILRK